MNNNKKSSNSAKNINPKIFGAYDIRGVYGKDFDKESFYLLGNAFAFYLNKIQKMDPKMCPDPSAERHRILVGRDVRLSSKELADAFMEGVLDFGCDVLDAGEVTTPMCIFGAADIDAFGGAMITASHNPAEYNGVKLVKEMSRWVGDDWMNSGELKKLYEIIKTEGVKVCGGENKGKKEGVDISEKYLNKVAKNFKPKKKAKIVVDASGGVTALFLPRLLEKLKIEYTPLFFEVDGSFKGHEPNPSLESSQKFAREKILETGADFGVLFDGDGDRMVILDEKGERARGDLIGMVVGDYFLKKGNKMLYDTISSGIVKDHFKEKGIEALRSRVGHAFIKEMMERESAEFAAELSSHYYFQDFYYAESAFFALRMFLEAFGALGVPVSEYSGKFLKYHSSDMYNFALPEDLKWEELLVLLKERFKNGKQEFEDGITVGMDDFERSDKGWWFNLRPSHTEPVVRLIIEAKKEEILEREEKRLREYLEKLGCEMASSYPL